MEGTLVSLGHVAGGSQRLLGSDQDTPVSHAVLRTSVLVMHENMYELPIALKPTVFRVKTVLVN